ncbi:hypothetical protein E6O75_ATG09549 [Venturia nashicola]|uniref:Uncharacterized protein n=1 Tax=Venturia nashicola TaxID=86259 RepID=A0A4Z1NM49_9PEZI|nr:hypothetical protein E6O75_ATG09549 [Venturia nashicola]
MPNCRFEIGAERREWPPWDIPAMPPAAGAPLAGVVVPPGDFGPIAPIGGIGESTAPLISEDDVVRVDSISNISLSSVLVSEVGHDFEDCTVLAWRFNPSTRSVTVWIKLYSGSAHACWSMSGLLIGQPSFTS